MWYCHESSHGRPAQDGMIRRLEIRDFEFNIFCAVVLASSKGNWQGYGAEWHCHISWNNPIEWGFGWGYGVDVEPHLVEGTREEYIQSTATITEYFGEPYTCHHRIED